jgi:MFS family permease
LRPGPSSARPAAADRAFALFTAGLLVATVLPEYLVASLAVSVREDFAFGDAALALAIGISFAIMAVISPLARRAIDRIGMRRGLALAVGLVAGSSLAIGLLARSAEAVIALMVVNGIGGGIGSPTFSALLARTVRQEAQGTAFGVLTSAPQMSAFAGGLALPLIAVPLDWRVAFALPAAIGLACFAALARSGRLDVPPGPPVPEERRRGLRSIHAIAVATALASAGGIGMRSFLVIAAVSMGMQRGAAGLVLSATGLIAIGSRLGFGVLGDRRPGDSLRRAAALLLLCAGGYGLMALDTTLLLVAGALVAGGVGWGWQAPLTLAVVSRNREATAAAVGIQFSGFYVGALLGPLLVAFAVSRSGYPAAWLLCALLAVGAAAIVLAVGRAR